MTTVEAGSARQTLHSGASHCQALHCGSSRFGDFNAELVPSQEELGKALPTHQDMWDRRRHHLMHSLGPWKKWS